MTLKFKQNINIRIFQQFISNIIRSEKKKHNKHVTANVIVPISMHKKINMSSCCVGTSRLLTFVFLDRLRVQYLGQIN